MIYKILHSKLMIKQHESHKRNGVNIGALEGLILPVIH
jgi:hypothetical protein